MIDMKLLRDKHPNYRLMRSTPFRHPQDNHLFVVLGKQREEVCCHIYNTISNVLSEGKYSNPTHDYDKRVEDFC